MLKKCDLLCRHFFYYSTGTAEFSFFNLCMDIISVEFSVTTDLLLLKASNNWGDSSITTNCSDDCSSWQFNSSCCTSTSTNWNCGSATLKKKKN